MKNFTNFAAEKVNIYLWNNLNKRKKSIGGRAG